HSDVASVGSSALWWSGAAPARWPGGPRGAPAAGQPWCRRSSVAQYSILRGRPCPYGQNTQTRLLIRGYKQPAGTLWLVFRPRIAHTSLSREVEEREGTRAWTGRHCWHTSRAL